MKNRLIKLFLIVFAVNVSFSQAWMTDLGIAQQLAMVENKMVLMVWEGTTEYPYPVYVYDSKGRTLFVDDLFTDENISPLIWKHFIPVIVSEDQYGTMYYKIKGKRSQKYVDKFNDNSIKIMDVNGNIINTSDVYNENLENISKIIQLYSLDTAFLASELKGYHQEETFLSAYYLASKYMDYAMFVNTKLRKELLALANIYNNEAKLLTKNEPAKEQSLLKQRCELLNIQQYLLLKRPKKALRLLKRIGAENIDNTNSSFTAYLLYTAYSSAGKEEKAEKWKSKISSVNLKKAQKLINLNS